MIRKGERLHTLMASHRHSTNIDIFVCSMADIFGDWVPEEWITQITDAFKEAPQHNYLFLTKNPIRMISMIERGILEERENFWFGTTSTKAEDAFFASETANAFVSVEPMHGPLEVIPPSLQEQLKWVIFGAETGNRKDKIVPEPDWILEAAYNFEQLGIPVFMKDSLIPIIVGCDPEGACKMVQIVGE